MRCEVRLALGMSDIVQLVVLAMSVEDKKVEPWTKKFRQVSDYQIIRAIKIQWANNSLCCLCCLNPAVGK